MPDLKPVAPAVKAFISCSLREQDRQFNGFVEKFLFDKGITSFGTVGRYSASPENVAESMKKNIPYADLVVIIATPRYLQKDLKTGAISKGLSEMVHVETGMAYAMEKPVLMFVQEGTNVGNFLPNITQYIVLNGKQEDLTAKYNLIHSLLENAFQIIKQVKDKKSKVQWWHFIVGVFAVVGAIRIFQKIVLKGKKFTKRLAVIGLN